MKSPASYQSGVSRLLAINVLWLGLACGPAWADAPGVGLTARFEVDFLRFIIDHHYSALRMTELAAGTDATRDPVVPGPAEGTSPTPGYAATPAKAVADDIQSMARMENRMQREEIQTALRYLREWYQLDQQPSVDARGRRQIGILEGASRGADFEHLFLEVMSRHHYTATTRANECLVASDLKHKDLMRYCSGIQHAQLAGIDEMRNMLCKRFQICDYQPLRGLKGVHSGSHAERHGDDGD